MKIVFMGTPAFSVPVLEGIIKDGHQVGYVITQPDKAKDRGKKIQFTAVKETAVKLGIEVLQPEKIKESPQTIDQLRAYEPDLIVVVAYGQIISKEILQLPKFGCINVHASLLPKLRGASPIQHAILSGEKITGVTIMQMEEGLDTGDMLTQAEVEIGKMNCEELHDVLSVLGAQLLVQTLPMIENATVIPKKQDDQLSTYAGMIAKQHGCIDFSKTPEEIERKIRAFDPWPGAFCRYGDVMMKIWKAECILGENQGPPGKIVDVHNEGIDVLCGNNRLRITEFQLPGKKRVTVCAFLKGNKIEKDTILG